MKRIVALPILLLVLAACTNNTSNTGTAHEGGDHSGHSHAADTATGGSTAMREMHRAMNDMMTQMHSMSPTGDADYDFATMMKHHHQSAVDMARAQLGGGQDSSLRALAQTIMGDQQREIAVFDQYLQQHTAASGTSDYGKKAMGMMTEMGNMNMQGGSVDVMFASMMIPHHQDGVKMAQAYLEAGKNEALKQVAQHIIKTQPREADQLQRWLAANKQQ